MDKSCIDFSIIVPTYNRPVQLSACIEALSHLQYPKDRYEVIIVDDGSPEPVTLSVVDRNVLPRICLYRQNNRGPAAARNLGATHARGRWLAFTDDDCLPATHWLQNLALMLQRSDTDVVGGRTLNGLPDNTCSTASQVIVDAVYRYYNAKPEQSTFFASNNLAVSHKCFNMLGGFDETFTTSEDRDFCDRCLCQGRRLSYAPEAVVYHRHRLSFCSFCRQHFNYGRGAYHFAVAQRCRRSANRNAPFAFHMALHNWLFRPFVQTSPRQWVPLAALLVAWQVMNIAGFIGAGTGIASVKLPDRT